MISYIIIHAHVHVHVDHTITMTTLLHGYWYQRRMSFTRVYIIAIIVYKRQEMNLKGFSFCKTVQMNTFCISTVWESYSPIYFNCLMWETYSPMYFNCLIWESYSLIYFNCLMWETYLPMYFNCLMWESYSPMYFNCLMTLGKLLIDAF